MKKLIVLMFAAVLISFTANAQRFVYVDTEYILEKIPEYNQAQEKLDAISEEWKQEADRRVKEIDQMYKRFQAEQYLMDDETKVKRENEIIAKEKELKEYQQQKFGYEGELYDKRQELVQPIMDKVYDAVLEIAEERKYDFIFDKASSGTTMLFSNPKFDRSDDVLKKLGY